MTVKKFFGVALIVFALGYGGFIAAIPYIPDDVGDYVSSWLQLPAKAQPLRVLVYYETADAMQWTPEQKSILTDIELRKYLAGHCPVENGASAFRFFDAHSDITQSPKFNAQWEAAVKSGKKKCLVITTPKTTKVFDLPNDPAATLKTLETYGGQ